MNRAEKETRIAEIAKTFSDATSVYLVNLQGLTVPQVTDLRRRIKAARGSCQVVKNRLTIRAADKAGAESLKELLEGPTAFTFVSAEGDVALAAKALAQFRRETELLEFKGGVMGGEIITAEQITALSRLPARDVLHQQLVAMVASPITGLVRGLNALIAGLAIQLQQIAEQGLVGDGEAAAEEAEPTAPE